MTQTNVLSFAAGFERLRNPFVRMPGRLPVGLQVSWIGKDGIRRVGVVRLGQRRTSVVEIMDWSSR